MKPAEVVILMAAYGGRELQHDGCDLGSDELDKLIPCIVHEFTLNDLVRSGLLSGNPSDAKNEGYSLTEKGVLVCEKILATPMPKQKWVYEG